MTAPATTHAGRGAWLVLAYRLPTSHGLKTAIRRRLTTAGAVFPANAVAALPASPTAERTFRRVRRLIGEAGGSAQVLRAEVIEGAADLVAAFNAAATDPYPVSIAVGPAGAWYSRVTVTGTATSRKQTARLTAL